MRNGTIPVHSCQFYLLFSCVISRKQKYTHRKNVSITKWLDSSTGKSFISLSVQWFLAFINKNNLGVSIKIHPYGNFLVRTHVFGIDLELHSFVCRQIGFRHSINIRTVSSLFSAVHLSLLGWSGVEIICTVHVALPKQPI